MSKNGDGQFGQEWYDRKTLLMEKLLGKEHEIVMHAVTPYELGGALDLYYYPNGISGTAVATKECSESPDEGSTNAFFDVYELVMFTKHGLSIDDANDESTPFGRVHSNIDSILNSVAPYSAQAKLNRFETCEFPEDMKTLGGKCLIFDTYGVEPTSKLPFGLLVVIEVFRSEMEFAHENGGSKLIARLTIAGHYPYSDMEREPVV